MEDAMRALDSRLFQGSMTLDGDANSATIKSKRLCITGFQLDLNTIRELLDMDGSIPFLKCLPDFISELASTSN